MITEIELVYRYPKKLSEQPIVANSKDAYEVLLQAWDMDKIELAEQVKLLILNASNRVLGVCNLSSGGLRNNIIDVRHVFAAGIKANAASIILAHNHPSQSLEPSESDILVTKELKVIGDVLGMQFVDHIIVTKEGFFSFSDAGLLG